MIIDYILCPAASETYHIPTIGDYVAEWCEVHAVLDAIIETKKNMRKQIIFFNFLLFIYSFL